MCPWMFSLRLMWMKTCPSFNLLFILLGTTFTHLSFVSSKILHFASRHLLKIPSTSLLITSKFAKLLLLMTKIELRANLEVFLSKFRSFILVSAKVSVFNNFLLTSLTWGIGCLPQYLNSTLSQSLVCNHCLAPEKFDIGIGVWFASSVNSSLSFDFVFLAGIVIKIRWSSLLEIILKSLQKLYITFANRIFWRHLNSIFELSMINRSQCLEMLSLYCCHFHQVGIW